MANCEICGDPMPPGEEMFKFHGYSGPCPKPPLPSYEPLKDLEAVREVLRASLACLDRLAAHLKG